MALALCGWSLNSMPPPEKPTEVIGDEDLLPAFPIDEHLHVQSHLSDGGEPLLLDGGATCRRARVDSGDCGVPSLETRQSYFSSSMPTKAEPPAPPNRILHNRHKDLVEKMMKDVLPFLYCISSGSK
ncbi:HSP31 [Symbiodinium sp. CCMP2592]|nr:HSP31 [Symbiodinium sp. CCMP2592]